MKNMKKSIVIGALGLALFLTGCGDEKDTATSDSKDKSNDEVSAAVNDEKETTIIPAHQDLNQEPIPIKFERVGEHKVNIEMTAQITDIEIAPNEIYKAWTFNGEAPGPLIVVNEGDTMNFTLKNMDPAIPHSMDFHAVETSPTKNFIDIMPDESGTFTFTANRPGVFMYHCATGPALSHIANGMHGVVIVKPKDGYPTDDIVDKEFALIQNEWYNYNDLDDFTDGTPNQVVFSTKALKEGDRNTNGDTFTLKDEPLQAKVGDRIRLYINNVGPNQVSSFHVVGAQFDVTYLDGNPENVLKGMQTVQLPASGGAVVEFEVFEEGDYTIVTHQFNHVQKGAAAIIRVTE
ncbi:multicopper oxidase domain-containing protein [Paucisalibacillus globulus]|jgi:nitrite reductase (NO-forming)|uniref:multicopper oxidase domain-containing protein n=1 Tax=Paucisalibacillus globulus TaxID=351095 RepID=UPI000BB8CFC0|nr:multicopper oxidase domain-containing protein [Paucisalibacillus globulus]